MTQRQAPRREATNDSPAEPLSERTASDDRPSRGAARHAEERMPASQPGDDLLDIPAFLRRQAN
jgi:cell division protein FtsZ